MKKTLPLLCVFSILMLCILAGCSNNDTFEQKTFLSGEDIISSLVVDVTDRQLNISVSDDDQIHLEYYDGKKEFLNIKIENNTLFVKLTFDKKWSDFLGKKAALDYRKIYLRIPSSITDITVNSTNENITVTQLNTKNIYLSNVGGDIKLNKLNVEKEISINVKNGDINGSVIGGYDDFAITCTIKKGNSNLPAEKINGKKTLKTFCNNGDINIEFII